MPLERPLVKIKKQEDEFTEASHGVIVNDRVNMSFFIKDKQRLVQCIVPGCKKVCVCVSMCACVCVMICVYRVYGM